MLRFGDLLNSKKNTHSNLDIEETFPTPVFRRICVNGKLRKWAAYIDKYLLFPKKLKRELLTGKDPIHLIHIIDHSNSIYLPKLTRMNRAKKIITCHDFIAIRTAYGKFPFAPKTSKSGKRLQKWIHNSLEYADYYACDSQQTKQDLTQLIPGSELNSAIIHLGTENNFLTTKKQRPSLDKLPFNPSKTNYLLHVGSAAWYKNRQALYKSFLRAWEKLPNLNLKLILVGPKPQNQELNTGLFHWLKSHPNSLISLANLSENHLGELYKNAQALVFPSHVEGFGWPPLEAAVCGCPVITTPTGAIEDLLGNYAKYVEAENQESIDQGVLQALQLPRSTQGAIPLPSHEDCRRQYFDLYEQVMVN